MSRFGKSADDIASVEREPRTYSGALGQLRSGGAALAAGSGGLGVLLARSGYALAKTGVAKLRESGAAQAVDNETTRRSGNKAKLAVGGAVVAALAAGAAFFSWSRRRHVPEPAAAPPSLTPSANGSAPAQPAPETVSEQA